MSSAPRVEVVTAVPALQLGEGPHWSEAEDALFLVDLLAGGVHRLDAVNQKSTATKPGGGLSVSLVVPVSGRRGLLAVGHGRDLSVLSWDGASPESKVRRVLASVEGESQKSRGPTRFNDGKADPTGRLWAGTMSTAIDVGDPQPRHGSLYSLEDGGVRAQQRVADVDISNGLAWAGELFFFIDSTSKLVEAFDFEPQTGNIANRRTVFDFAKNDVEGVPDGMTVDTAGNLWVACFGGSQVICVDPRTGQLTTRVPLPAVQITSAAWGGRGFDELYVTSAALREQAGKPQAGALFRVTGLGARGEPPADLKLDPRVLAEL